MEQLAQLKARIDSLGDLQGIMHAMRGIAASRLREAHDAIPAMDAYASTIRKGMAEAAALQREAGQVSRSGEKGFNSNRNAAPSDASLMIALCSEHGFVGAYNDRILNATDKARKSDQDIAVVGYKGILLAEERQAAPQWTMPMASSLDASPILARAIADKAVSISSLDITYAAYKKGGGYEIKTEQVLPVPHSALTPAPGNASAAPLHQLSANQLIEALSSEYLYAQALRCIVEALTSENAARLSILQAADQNISDKLEEFGRQARVMRQEEITTELMDVVTGAMAVGEDAAEPA